MFRGAELHIEMKRDSAVLAIEVYVNGDLIEDGIIRDLRSDVTYKVNVKIPSVS